MWRQRRRRSHAATMVEFSIVAPLVLLIVFGIVDFSRAINAQNTIADAARQAARQATANAKSSPDPFTGYSSQACSGTALTYNVANNAGCLTDAALMFTIKSVLGSVAPGSNVTQQTVCTGNPAVGQVWVCISPKDICAPACTATDTACPTTPPNLPAAGTEGDRQTEWTSANGYAHKGCFLVQVTIVYTYQPLTPVIGKLMGSGVTLRTSTAIVAEY